MSSPSDKSTIDSSPRRRFSQNVDTESAPGNLPAMPTTAIALGGRVFVGIRSLFSLLTLVVLPFAAWSLVGVPRRVHALDRELRSLARWCRARRGRVDRAIRS